MTKLVKSNAEPAAETRPERGWIEAVHLLTRWLEQRERVDELLGQWPATLRGVERAHGQSLILGVVRHAGRIAAPMRQRVQRPPRRLVEAILYAGGFELIESGAERQAKVVHYCVEQTKRLASPAEAKLVNAVLRRMAEDFAAQGVPGKLATARQLADYYSHPEWLVARWLATFGGGATQALLRWNSQPGEVVARWRGGAPSADLPGWLTPTEWPDYFTVATGNWGEVEAALRAGRIFIQDPATRWAVDYLDPRPGEILLDLCAAPGGKSVALADRMQRGGLVAVDLPGPRQERLAENLAKVRGVQVARVAGDVRRGLEAILQREGLPIRYAAVCLDVPCSNTGVMRHRVDVKDRLQVGDFARHAEQQLRMLRSAAALVAPGGRIVYSTCSIDPEENERVVEAFVEAEQGAFQEEARQLCRPWEIPHDGAGVFRLRRMR